MFLLLLQVALERARAAQEKRSKPKATPENDANENEYDEQQDLHKHINHGHAMLQVLIKWNEQHSRRFINISVACYSLPSAQETVLAIDSCSFREHRFKTTPVLPPFVFPGLGGKREWCRQSCS